MARRSLLLVIVIFFGLFSRRHPVGLFAWDKSLGDAMYAAAVYLVLLLSLPRCSAASLAFLAAGFCLGIECFKLTGLPHQWGASSVVSRLIFGRAFSWLNLLAYAVAIAILYGVERLALRLESPRS